ncbi:hypothetical protein C5E51_34385 [Nocardia nova]|uniref:hypothetical protein n=1 Tax=Nocardia nova TaxID=37330 RepID=UPI000CE9C325|nr:hypothetical protein [Nocardia nova]PPJ01206.1 hypothetical protein C5E51_34385 [Nocardia nova]
MDSEALRTGCLNAITEGISIATGFLLGNEKNGIDADFHDPKDIQHRRQLQLLDQLERDQGLSPEDLARHPGHPPIPEDRRTHAIIQGQLKRTFPDCYVVGEEATKEEWLAAIQAPPQSLILSVDAIDGSTLYESLTFGYACNLLAYRREENDANRLLISMVANSSGFLAWYERYGQGAWVGNLYKTDQNTQLPRIKNVFEPRIREEFSEDRVAVNAFDGERRRLIAPLLANDELKISTLGGAPAALGLIYGRLGALVCPKPQATYDTAYLPVLASLGIKIFTLKEGILLGLEDVLQFFDHIAGVGGAWTPDGVTKPVPPLIAARDPLLAGRLRTLLNS